MDFIDGKKENLHQFVNYLCHLMWNYKNSMCPNKMLNEIGIEPINSSNKRMDFWTNFVMPTYQFWYRFIFILKILKILTEPKAATDQNTVVGV